ncbi:MAG: hypothetical protein LBJ64_11730 [Deltaproteobacteria bacterium]|nr:hypothetical protein [Deltaproteobacteria bacterium]
MKKRYGCCRLNCVAGEFPPNLNFDVTISCRLALVNQILKYLSIWQFELPSDICRVIGQVIMGRATTLIWSGKYLEGTTSSLMMSPWRDFPNAGRFDGRGGGEGGLEQLF